MMGANKLAVQVYYNQIPLKVPLHGLQGALEITLGRGDYEEAKTGVEGDGNSGLQNFNSKIYCFN